VQVVELYEQFQSQVEVADYLNVEQSSISRVLNNAFYQEIKNAEEQLVKFLKNRYPAGNALQDR
jgi:predicted XRE-type DNA-binding protein